MGQQLSKRERLEAVIADEAVDRTPVALWRHWPVDDQHSSELARVTLEFQRTYDFDFVKVTPNSNFAISGYGAESRWEGNEEGTRVWGARVIQTPDDWLALRPLDPRDGLLGEVLVANTAIGRALGEETPFIQTIFNPLAQAKNLAGARLVSHMRQYPDAVKAGLAVITESTLRFIDALTDTGAAGIFLAVQHATYDLLTEDEYRSFCRGLDLQILSACGDFWFNMVHLHGSDVMFDLVAEYPAQAINWHDAETPPSLHDALKRTRMALCGGLRQWATMVRGAPESVRGEALEALAATHGRRLILGTGCVTPIITPTSNILAARHAVDGIPPRL